MGSWLKCRQKRLGVVGTFAMLVFTCFVTPFSLDMFTPALPQMVLYFESDVPTVNLAILLFYVFFAAGQLVFGPLSDEMGRKPVFLGGSVVYALGSIACFLCNSIPVLLCARVVQALGAGAIAAVSIAMVKDVFMPDRMDDALSVITAIFGVGPIAAPLFGAFLMQIMDWHAIFAALAVFGAICVLFGLLLEEPLSPEDRVGGEGPQVVAGLVRVLRNKGFTLYMCVMAIIDIAFMAYISVASHIYITFFGLDEIGYGLYFGVGMVIMLVGPALWPIASRFMGKKLFTWLLIGGCILSGVLLLVIGSRGPVFFCVSFALFILMESSSRPFSMGILLVQQEEDAGAAASLTNCSRTVFGTFGMALAVLPWGNYILGLGTITIVSMACSALLWILLLRTAKLKGVE